MDSSKSLRALAEISSGQWGMVTTSQASSKQVSRVQIARLAESGHLERLAHGVYRDAGSAPHEFDDIRAAWLSLDPDRVAEDRIRDGADGIVVSGNTAAALHGIGDLLPTPYQFTSRTRRQSQRPDIRFKQRTLLADQVTLVDGIPTTGVERTIADLVHDKEDLSLVGDLVGDALRAGSVQLDYLGAILSPLAARNGFPKDDGLAVLRKLLELGHVDVATQINRVVSNPAWRTATSPPSATALSATLSRALAAPEMSTALARAISIPDMSAVLAKAMSTPDMSSILSHAINIPDMSAVLAKAIIPDMSAVLAKAINIPDVSAALAKAMSTPDMSSILSHAINVPDMSAVLAKAIEGSQSARFEEYVPSVQALVRDVNSLQSFATPNQAPDAG